MSASRLTITNARRSAFVMGVWSLMSLCLSAWGWSSEHGHGHGHDDGHAEAAASDEHEKHETKKVASKLRPSTCAVIENVEGVVEVLSPDRKTLLPVHERSDVECGSWISTAQGWIRVRHSQGYQVQVGPESFLKVSSRSAQEDQITVFKGGIFVKSASGQGELRVATTNSRARIKSSAAILVYQEQDAFTQLIAVEGRPSLENRFEDEARIYIKPGESTSFHTNLKRISPSTPKGTSVASLRPKLQALHVEESLISRATKAASTRVNRKFASIPSDEHENHGEEAAGHGATATHGKKKSAATSDYSRSPASVKSSAEDEFLARKWKEKTQIFEKKKTEVLKEISDTNPED